jgi:hypothetical protein
MNSRGCRSVGLEIAEGEASPSRITAPHSVGETRQLPERLVSIAT